MTSSCELPSLTCSSPVHIGGSSDPIVLFLPNHPTEYLVPGHCLLLSFRFQAV